jgi:Protein of unknown function (DUF3618)
MEAEALSTSQPDPPRSPAGETDQVATGPGGADVSTIRSVPLEPERPRSPAQIEADIEQTRERLAGTVDAIADRVKPANVARRAADSARSTVVDDDGYPRLGRIAALAGVAIAITALLVWRRRR